MVIRVGLVDDQPLVRAGFALLVNSQDDLTVVWQAGDGDDLPTEPADVVLMDVQMPRVDGITAARQLLVGDDHVRVIMLTTFDDEAFVSGAIAAGASGFLLKDSQPEQLLHAIRTVAEGNAILSPKVTAGVLRQLQGDVHQEELDLTARERDILRLIALGYNNEEIAAQEFVSMSTVKTHVRHILLKTGSRDRVHAVLRAYRSGLVRVDELLIHPQGG